MAKYELTQETRTFTSGVAMFTVGDIIQHVDTDAEGWQSLERGAVVYVLDDPPMVVFERSWTRMQHKDYPERGRDLGPRYMYELDGIRRLDLKAADLADVSLWSGEWPIKACY